MAMIDFGVQSSCLDDSDGNVINKPWNDLLEIFYDDLEMGDYFTSLEDFQIVFRISGDGNDFNGGDGPERLSVHSRGKVIAIDFVIPERKWRDVPSYKFREYLADGVSDCFKLLKEKAISINQIKNIKKLDEDFKRGLCEFRNRRNKNI